MLWRTAETVKTAMKATPLKGLNSTPLFRHPDITTIYRRSSLRPCPNLGRCWELFPSNRHVRPKTGKNVVFNFKKAKAGSQLAQGQIDASQQYAIASREATQRPPWRQTPCLTSSSLASYRTPRAHEGALGQQQFGMLLY